RLTSPFNHTRRAMPILSKMIGFVVTTDSEKAKALYGDRLVFRLISSDQYALAFDANGTMLRVSKAQQFTPARGTVLGWEADDIHAVVRELTARGALLEQVQLA